ncbi:MAG: GNAT family N-acetyltransferase [Rhodobacteraceae bacterium]|nr:GNAT family N-acetyltransferase [Paracoccaceae bacterium]
MKDVTISAARSHADIADAGALFLAYAQFLEDDFGIDLAFQNFSEELAGLPGKYAPPDGEILLARAVGGACVGCIAYRRHDADSCEMKRLYVVPDARGHALGRQLIDALLTSAQANGYRRIILDTGEFLDAAVSLYQSYGFVEIPPYNDSPVAGMRYFALDLQA